jgi:hypothetical protein
MTAVDDVPRIPRRSDLRAVLAALVRGARAVLRPTPGPFDATAVHPAQEGAAASPFCCGGTAPRCFCPADPRHR